MAAEATQSALPSQEGEVGAEPAAEITDSVPSQGPAATPPPSQTEHAAAPLVEEKPAEPTA